MRLSQNKQLKIVHSNTKNFSGIRLLCFLFLPLILLLIAWSRPKKDKKVPVIYITDLYHPHHDLDDHFDLVAMYAKGI